MSFTDPSGFDACSQTELAQGCTNIINGSYADAASFSSMVRSLTDNPDSIWVYHGNGYPASGFNDDENVGHTWQTVDASGDGPYRYWPVVHVTTSTPDDPSSPFSPGSPSGPADEGGPSGPSDPGGTSTLPQTKKPDTCKNAAQPDRSLGDQVSDAVVGFGDAFLIPIVVRDLLDIDGGVDYDSSAYSGGNIAGIVWGAIPLALEGAAAVGATRFGHVLNHNRYLRIGPGRMPAAGRGLPSGTNVPRASVGSNGRHIDLRSRVPPIPPVGALAGGNGC